MRHGDAGNKEAFRNGEPTPSVSPPAGSPYENAQKHRRFQIYVHSKLMIVDDEVRTASAFALHSVPVVALFLSSRGCLPHGVVF